MNTDNKIIRKTCSSQEDITQPSMLTLWHNLSEDEQGTISGGIGPMLPVDLIHIRIRGRIPNDEVHS